MIRLGQVVTHKGNTYIVGNDINEMSMETAKDLQRRGELTIGQEAKSYPMLTAKNRRDYASPVLTKYLKENKHINETLSRHTRLTK